MKNHIKSRGVLTGLSAFSILLIACGEAYAYIDPGTGSYVLQIVIASVLAAGFVIKATWRNIMGAIGKRFAKRDADEQ